MMRWLGKFRPSTGPKRRGGGLLRRLARDKAGNTLALMAAALIPLAGLVGSGIDMSRMYITKTRLQHACDAGALAGRKNMGAGSWNTASNNAAVLYFDANFVTGSYGSNTLTRSFNENGGTVTGTASTVLPMTMTRIIGQSTQTIAVTCSSTMQMPNTDVMFVLDTTGSMNCVASDTSCSNNNNIPAPGSKIVGLKNAVKCFYEAVAQQKTNGTCTTTPSGNLNSSVQVRFGFVPYSSNVNVGYLLSPTYFANSWKYQSREPQWTNTTTYTYPAYSDTGTTNSTNNGSWSSYQNDSVTNVGYSRPNCSAPASSSSSNTTSSDSSVTESNNTRTYSTTTTTTTTTKRYTSTLQSGYDRSGNRYYYCQVQVSTKTDTSTQTTNHQSQGVPTTTKTFNQWHYGQIATDISGLKNGMSWNTSMTAPIGPSGVSQTIAWDGCIEEAQTVRSTSYSPMPSGANDLNIDLIPSQGDSTTLWGPALEPLIYMRNMTSSNSSPATTSDSYTANDYYSSPNYTCPTAAQKLQVWSSTSNFDDYVDSLTAKGNTYHDIGMLWGARLMSPSGIFASENGLAANGGTINRNMIFMTDGDSTSQPCDYNAYGVPWWDQRQSTDVGPASQCLGYNRQALIDQINLRYAALCTLVKNKGINLYVISYGNGSSAATETRLSNCASTGAYYKATDPAALQTAFTAIAAKITMLRLTQ